jgi:hypothetical protein
MDNILAMKLSYLKYCRLLVLSVLLTSCVVIPKQAPQLSEELGKQIGSLERSHISLLHSYFEQKRSNVDDFMENTWLPEFASNFFSKPELEDAWNEIVESKNKKDRLDFLVQVGPQLQIVINDKREELVKPLNDLERELEMVIREEYNLARSMNNTLTSFLVSAAKVKENQQRYLDMLKITDDKIADAIDQTDAVVSDLLGYAEKIAEAQDKAKAYATKADEYKKKLSELKDKIRK